MAQWPNKRFVALSDEQATWLREEAQRRMISESAILRESFEAFRQRQLAAGGTQAQESV